MRRMKVKNEPNLERDPFSNGIVNTNREAYEDFLIKKRKKEAEENRLNTIENEISEIKTLLQKLIDRG